MLAASFAALGILFCKNVFKAALLLLCCLLALAAVYVLSFAEFVAVTQVLVYAGGIVVVIIFGIMLTTKLLGTALIVKNGNILPGALAGIALFALLIKFFSEGFINDESQQVRSFDDNISETGVQLMTNYVLPFELAGILLLMALIGAGVITASIKKTGKIS